MSRTSLRMLVATLFATLAVVLSSVPARANTGEITTVNETKYHVHITIYDLGRTRHIDYGQVLPEGLRTWGRCCYAAGSYYYVRGQVMVGNSVIGDTTIQVVPSLARKNYGGQCSVFGYAQVILRNSGGNHFYWARHDNAPAECM